MDNSNIHILVVDDDPDLLFATARSLRKVGFKRDTGISSKHL